MKTKCGVHMDNWKVKYSKDLNITLNAHGKLLIGKFFLGHVKDNTTLVFWVKYFDQSGFKII